MILAAFSVRIAWFHHPNKTDDKSRKTHVNGKERPTRRVFGGKSVCGKSIGGIVLVVVLVLVLDVAFIFEDEDDDGTRTNRRSGISAAQHEHGHSAMIRERTQERVRSPIVTLNRSSRRQSALTFWLEK